MPDVISLAPADVRQFVALDVHKLSIVAATLPPIGRPAGDPSDRDDREGDPPIRLPSSAARRGWRSAMRPGPAGSRCGGCSRAWAWRATWSLRR